MDNLEHEDLLIKLRAKLNEEKIKLWEAPYVLENDGVSDSLKVCLFTFFCGCPINGVNFGWITKQNSYRHINLPLL